MDTDQNCRLLVSSQDEPISLWVLLEATDDDPVHTNAPLPLSSKTRAAWRMA
jgi:hypothetical protein